MDLPNQCEPKKSEAKYDPGWNDPPTFSYNAQPAPGTKPRLALNKRVAFPLQSTNPNTNTPHPLNSQAPPSISGMTPGNTNAPGFVNHFMPGDPSVSLNPSIPTIPQLPLEPLIPFNPLIPSNTNNNTSSRTNILDSKPMDEASNSQEVSCDVNEVVDILHSILEENTELGNKIVDIKRRISVMKTMWTEGKLDNSIQMAMLKLSKALQNADTKTADEIHRALMVDHISSVSSWMVAIKQLIFHCTAKNELLDIDKE